MASQTKAQLEALNSDLTAQVEALTADVERLTAELAAAKTPASTDTVSTAVTFDSETHKFGVTKDGDTWVIIRAQGSDRIYRTFKAYGDLANTINNHVMDQATADQPLELTAVAMPARSFRGKQYVDYKVTEIAKQLAAV